MEVVIVTEELKDNYDVVVIGGGAAGLNGALMLARSRRSVLVVDAGHPRNAPAAAVHGLMARDGTPPAELLEQGRAEVRLYGGQVVRGEVVAASGEDAGFRIVLADGRTVQARRLLVAAGAVDELPEIPGLRDRWGRDVVHCPYCHGWEVRDQAIGVVASGPMAVHQALLFRQLSDDVTVFTHTSEPLGEEDVDQLAARGVALVHGEVAAVEVADDRIVGVRLTDGRRVPRNVLAVQSRMEVRAGFLDGLGLHPAEHPAGIGRHLPADAAGRTDIPGVWVAGNVTEPMAQVGGAAAAGANAGAQINADLVAEEARQAVAAYRDPLSAAAEARVSKRLAGSQQHGL
ncbi:NAD(P)/FAD-dependent oxidoreductase [Phytoactinopolyspora halotolerans]|uniref:NAD(P)/FAD-dependent oxidoreductase n=1 Tax=Phytoactinopolyspora halotolerans TaxID=1981512 RepID=A0A6L9S4U5_9ACTN|nr:NAD(P)/FAD-dependent oxidoreductase [Phytoactinopolyspora halotolerans]